MTLADREWRLIRAEARDGPMQMALEEIAAETAASGGPRTVRCLPVVAIDAVDGLPPGSGVGGLGVLRARGNRCHPPTDRGGGIYHDEFGDISYSIVAPADELPGDLMDCYEVLCEPILDAFHEMGVDAQFVPRSIPRSTNPPATCARSTRHTTWSPAGGR